MPQRTRLSPPPSPQQQPDPYSSLRKLERPTSPVSTPEAISPPYHQHLRQEDYPNKHNPKIMPCTLPLKTAIRLIVCPRNNIPVANNELFNVPNLATKTPATTGTIVFATRLLPSISDICESLIDNSLFKISFNGPIQFCE